MLLAIAVGIMCVDATRRAFRCHQFGVFRSTLFGQRTLRYAEMENFTYSSVRHYHNGVYTGTRFAMHFEPAWERRKEAIRYKISLRNSDDELDRLRDVVARIISGRLRERLAADGEVPWLSSATFTSQGLVTRPPGLFKRKEAILVPYTEVDTYQFDRGTFKLTRKGDTNPVLQCGTGERNFFPGMVLLFDLVGSAAGTSDSTLPSIS